MDSSKETEERWTGVTNPFDDMDRLGAQTIKGFLAEEVVVATTLDRREVVLMLRSETSVGSIYVCDPARARRLAASILNAIDVVDPPALVGSE